MHIGKRLKLLRKLHNLTQEEMAKRTGLSRTYISDLENERYGVTVATVENIIEIFDMSMAELYDLKERD